MADEASKHPNLPELARAHDGRQLGDREAATHRLRRRQRLPRAQRLHELRRPHLHRASRRARARRRRPGSAAGMVGLIEIDRAATPARRRSPPNEVMQIVRATADDIDFSTPNAVDPANNFGTPTGGLLDTVRYPTTPGWDATFGYGRVNIYEAVKAVRDGRIPPEADITSPQLVRRAAGDGHRRRSRAASRRRAPRRTTTGVEWAPGLQPPLYPATDVWHVVAQRSGLHTPIDGRARHARPGARSPPRCPTAAPARPSTRDRTPDEERFTRAAPRRRHRARRRRATACTARSQKQVFVHDDPDLVPGYPATSSPGVVDREPRVRQPRRQEGRRADRRDRRRLRARLPCRTARRSPAGRCTRADAELLARARRRRRDADRHPAAERRDRHRRAGGRRPRRRRPPRGRRRPTSTATCGRGRPTAPATPASADDLSTAARIAGARQSALLADDPRPARTSSTAPSAASRASPRSAISTATARSRSSPPRSTATCTRGTTTARRSPASPCCVVDPRRSRRSTRRRTTSPSSRTPASARAASWSRRRRSSTSTATAGPRSSSARRRSTPSRSTSARAPTCSRCSRRPARSGNARLYAISPDGTDAHEPRHVGRRIPTSRPTCRAGRSQLGMLQLESLPTIGDGVVDARPRSATSNPPPGPRGGRGVGGRAAVRAQRPRRRASSAQVDGKDVPLLWSGGLRGQDNALLRRRPQLQRHRRDARSRFGGAAIGELDADATPDVAAPTAGLTRLHRHPRAPTSSCRTTTI